jgi:hypothetical protein
MANKPKAKVKPKAKGQAWMNKTPKPEPFSGDTETRSMADATAALSKVDSAPPEEEAVEAEVSGEVEDLRVVVVAENFQYESRIRKVGERITLHKARHFDKYFLRWENNHNRRTKVKFNKTAIPGTFGAAMQGIALQKANTPLPDEPLA